MRSDSGYLTYIITTRRMTSGELLKYRNGLLMAQAYHGQRHRQHCLALDGPSIKPPCRMTERRHGDREADEERQGLAVSLARSLLQARA